MLRPYRFQSPPQQGVGLLLNRIPAVQSLGLDKYMKWVEIGLAGLVAYWGVGKLGERRGRKKAGG